MQGTCQLLGEWACQGGTPLSGALAHWSAAPPCRLLFSHFVVHLGLTKSISRAGEKFHSWVCQVYSLNEVGGGCIGGTSGREDKRPCTRVFRKRTKQYACAYPNSLLKAVRERTKGPERMRTLTGGNRAGTGRRGSGTNPSTCGGICLRSTGRVA